MNSGVSMNVARAVGRALGGLVVAATGPAAAFLLDALSFLGVLSVLARWRRPREDSGVGCVERSADARIA